MLRVSLPSLAFAALIAVWLVATPPAVAVPVQVTFSGEGWPRDALLPGTYAGRIYGKVLGRSTFERELIDVRAEWKPLGVFGNVAETHTSVFHDFLTDPPANVPYFSHVWYPTALAGHLAKGDKSLDKPDMLITFNSDRAFYFGLDGKPTGLQYDFYTVMLHELAHGLGLFSSIDADGRFEAPEAAGSPPRLPSVYDMFLAAPKEGDDIETLVTMSDADRKAASRSGAVFWTGDYGIALNRDKRVPIYSPADFSADASLSHLDPKAKPDALMLPTYAGPRFLSDAIVELGMLYDIGWLYPAQSLGEKLAEVPEPPGDILVLISLGIAGLAASRRRRQ